MTPADTLVICAVISFWAMLTCGFILYMASVLEGRIGRLEAAIKALSTPDEQTNPRLIVGRSGCRRHIALEVRR